MISCIVNPHENSLSLIVEKLLTNPDILFITGAGISAESGLPTYRGLGGLYNTEGTEDGMSIEEALSAEVFYRTPELTWKYLRQIESAVDGATYNRAHEIIAEISKRFSRVFTLTQNIDGFHRDVETKNLIEIHGNLHELKCPSCGEITLVKKLADVSDNPVCSSCGSTLRPNVVLFGEMLPEKEVLTLSRELTEGFDLIFSIGTSSVFPYISAPVLNARDPGVLTVEINPEETMVTEFVDVYLPLGAGEVLEEVFLRYLSASQQS